MFDNNKKEETFDDLDNFKCPSCNNIFDATCGESIHYDESEKYEFECDECGQQFKSQASCTWTFDVEIVD